MQNQTGPLTEYSCISITNEDRLKFLQGLVTIDVEKLFNNTGRICGMCNVKGRLIAIAYLFNYQDGLHLVLPKGLVDKTITHLNKYGAFFKCKIENTSDTYQAIFNSNTDNNKDSAICKLNTEDNLTINLIESSLDSKNELELEFIKNKVPMVFKESSELYLAQDINLVEIGGVDFDKGCYLGQEIIARMKYLAKKKKALSLITTSKAYKPSDKILDDNQKPIADVVNCIKQENNYLVLAITKVN